MNISKGTTLKYKGSEYTRKVLAVCDGAVLLGGSPIRFYKSDREWLTLEEVEELFEMPVETREPRFGDRYFFIEISDGRSCVTEQLWGNDELDKNRLRIGNIFNTRKEAEAVREKILAILKK